MARSENEQGVDSFFKEFVETHYLMTDPLIVDGGSWLNKALIATRLGFGRSNGSRIGFDRR